MSERHSEEGRTVKELGRDPWLHTDWQDLFERVAGSSKTSINLDTLSLAVSNKYDCDQAFGETVVRKAAECGQLLRINVELEGMGWEYYTAASDVISEPRNQIWITDQDILTGAKTPRPEAVSRDELIERLSSRPRQIPHGQIKYIADNIEYMTPFYVDGGELQLEPKVAERLLMIR